MKNDLLEILLTISLQTKRNDELSIELLNLVNAKAALMKQIHALSDSDPGVGDPEAEVSRVKAFVIKNSTGKVKVIRPPFIYIASNAAVEIKTYEVTEIKAGLLKLLK